MKRPGFDDKEKNMMLLPQATREGIYITGILHIDFWIQIFYHHLLQCAHLLS